MCDLPSLLLVITIWLMACEQLAQLWIIGDRRLSKAHSSQTVLLPKQITAMVSVSPRYVVVNGNMVEVIPGTESGDAILDSYADSQATSCHICNM